MRCRSPESLSGDHNLGDFTCGEVSLDEWLLNVARKAEKTGTAKTYVAVAGEGSRVVGYYSIAAGSVSRAQALGWLGKNSPDPVPTIVLARLAVDEDYQGEGVGGLLMLDAFDRILQASQVIGAKAIVVNPISQAARSFYLGWGFEELAGDPLTLIMRMANARLTLRGDRE
jgi:GNAT superfamily N-acetyltransferase